MNDVTLFQFNSAQVRVVMVDGEPWFITRDLCAILGIANAAQAMRNLEDKERGVCTVYTPGGPQKLNACSESGMYALIFNSRKPQAREFRQWVTSEVLPSIRKTGSYEVPAKVPEPAPERKEYAFAKLNVDLCLAQAISARSGSPSHPSWLS